MTRNGATSVVDATSRAIIGLLQEDGRRSYAAIGKQVGLSEAATRQRVQKLVDSGVVQIVAVTDPRQVGFDRQAMVAITATGNVEKLADALAAVPEVEYIAITVGSFDVLVEVVARDDDHLLQVVNERIRNLEGVVRTESFVYLKLVKQTYNWGR